MNVKGTAVTTIPLFIKSKFGEVAYNKWLNALAPASQKIFTTGVLVSSWYPLDDALIHSTLKICELFYSGNLNGAVDQGRFSAEHALKGIYKLFVKLGSVDFIIAKASSILPTYYAGSAMSVVHKGDKTTTVRITRFDGIHTVIEHRIKGWIERALEISGANNPRAKIASSMAAGAPVTDFVITWN